MKLNKDPESWARVKPELVMTGSDAQIRNVLTMALQDIQRLAQDRNYWENEARKKYDDDLCRWESRGGITK